MILFYNIDMLLYIVKITLYIIYLIKKILAIHVKTCYHINVLNIYVFKGGADIWQNAISAEKKLFLVLRFLTHIEDLTEPGNLMSNVLKRSSTVLLREFTPAPVACVLIRLPVRYNLFLKNDILKSSYFYIS